MPRRAGATDPTAPHALTAASVAALPVTNVAYVVRDTREGGFAVAVGRSGKKSFTVDFRVSGDRTKRRMTLGSYPSVLPEQARRQAASVKVDATLKGTDQAKARRVAAGVRKAAQLELRQARTAARDAKTKTLRVFAERFMIDAALRARASTMTLYRGLLDRHILPALAERVVTEVTTADVATFHAARAATPTTANHCLRLLSTIFRYAERTGDRARGTNPATDVPRFRESLIERYLQPHELAALLRALDTAEVTGLPAAPWRLRKVTAKTAKHAPAPRENKKNIARGTVLPANPHAVAALRLLILTGARKSEILGLKWAEVDTSRAVLILADSKTGRSVRPLSPAALEVLRRVTRMGVSPYVFASPSRRADATAQPIKDLSRLWDAVRHAAGLESVRLHDLRHTAASLMLQSGATLAEVGRAIGHASARTTQRYAHIADAGAQRAAELLGVAVERASHVTATPVRPLRHASS